MVRAVLTKFLRGSVRLVHNQQPSLLRSAVAPHSAITLARPIFRSGPIRSLTYTNRVRKGITPESEDPQPHEPESNTPHKQAAELTAAQYQELSEEYMNMVVEKLEQLQEEREDVDVEYSIWLSSPISGPKRYDFVVTSEGQDSKEGTGEGEWIYLRDGSSLNELLLKEVGVDLSRSYTPEMQGED
ncbi:mitochondrial iron uptake protein [Rutstroemia sp. NJR-2017a WRK4]|nr:mitochondrial iron uptake protein [Rutstroemia sp. NJR-2017a WRK4]